MSWQMSHRVSNRRSLAHAVAATFTVSVLAGAAQAQNVFWDGGAGADRNWSNAVNWDTDTEPGIDNDVHLNNGGIIDITEAGEIGLTFRIGGAADIGLSPVNLGLGGTVNFAATGTLATGPFIPSVDIGVAPGATSVWNHNGGTLTTLELFRIGVDAGSAGTLNMNSGLIDISTGDTTGLDFFLVGDNGHGNLNVNGGEIRMRTLFGAGFQIGSSATINMTNGLLKTNEEFLIGRFGNVNATVSGGTIDSRWDIRVAQLETSTSVLNMSGGLMRTDFQVVVGGATWNGLAANGTINLSGGTINAGTRVLLSDSWMAQSTVNHTGGLMTGREILVGLWSDSTYNLSGTGTIDAKVQINLGTFQPRERDAAGEPATPVARLTQSGTTSVTTGGLIVGEQGTGIYTMNGGSLTVLGVARDHNGTASSFPGNDQSFGNLIVGRDGGTITFNEGPNQVTINKAGDGQFIQNGGTVQVNTNVFLGDFDEGHGRYTISGGSLTVNGNLNVGAALASNAPADDVRTGDQGQASGARGTFTVRGNAATINVGGNLVANPADKTRAALANRADLVFEIEGAAGTSVINVAGAADLDGATVDLTLLGTTYVPAYQSNYTLITAGSFGATGTGTTENTGTGTAYTLAAGDVTDWTLAIVNAAGGRKSLVATYQIVPGDTNNNKIVNFDDLLTLAQSYGETTGQTRADGDFNRSGGVTFDDLLILAQNYGFGTAGLIDPTGVSLPSNIAADWALALSIVPEPTSLLGIAASSGLLLRRRRSSAVPQH